MTHQRWISKKRQGFAQMARIVPVALVATVSVLVGGNGSLRAQDLAPRNLDTCFSPGGGCDKKLVDFVQSARSTLDVAIYSLTLKDLEKAIAAAKNRGVTVRVVVDRSESKARTSEVSTLLADGVEVKIGAVQGIMHNKFTIVDGRMVETGSFNYSFSATKLNAENQIYLSDAGVVEQYQAAFDKLWEAGLEPANPSGAKN